MRLKHLQEHVEQFANDKQFLGTLERRLAFLTTEIGEVAKEALIITSEKK
ncbi:hypothetical protein [Paenibacillus elgii]|nr:hypothetical protein [Paenibacillus elgii]